MTVFGYDIVGIPFAAGIPFPFIGVLLSTMIASLAMTLSSVSVITNSLRVKNLWKSRNNPIQAR